MRGEQMLKWLINVLSKASVNIVAGLLSFSAMKYIENLQPEIPIILYKVILFILFIVLLVNIFLLIRNLIVKHRDSNQLNRAPIAFAFNTPPDHTAYDTYKGFIYEIEYDYPNSFSIHRSEKELRDVTGPLCVKDNFELICKKNFWGTYTYRCHHCESKYKSKYNKYTLEHNSKEFFRKQFK